MDSTTTDETLEEMILRHLVQIDARLARLEDTFSRYEPLLIEASRRMAGPMKWLK